MGVTVTALCPGATASGFQERAAMQKSGLLTRMRVATAEQVGAAGYRAMMAGRAVFIHSQPDVGPQRPHHPAQHCRGPLQAHSGTDLSKIEWLAFVIMPVSVAPIGCVAAWLGLRFIP
jgi:hypothetical protein